MTAPTPPPKPPMAPTRKLPPPPPSPPAAVARAKVVFGQVQKSAGNKVVLYGPGGIGKTTLASYAPGPVAFFDLDESLPVLRGKLEEAGTLGNIVPVSGVTNWAQLREALQSDGWDQIKTIVIDSATRAEEMAIAHTLETVSAEGGKKVSSIEGYGYGKGYTHSFETWLPIFVDLDRHARAGRNVILICHDCTTSVPNPAGEDWLRYEPRLQSPTSGKASIRLRVKEWADHVLFVGYDVAVNKDGKASGCGTRTLYPSELPHCMAKSRSSSDPMAVEDPSAIWAQIIK